MLSTESFVSRNFVRWGFFRYSRRYSRCVARVTNKSYPGRPGIRGGCQVPGDGLYWQKQVGPSASSSYSLFIRLTGKFRKPFNLASYDFGIGSRHRFAVPVLCVFLRHFVPVLHNFTHPRGLFLCLFTKSAMKHLMALSLHSMWKICRHAYFRKSRTLNLRVTHNACSCCEKL